MLFLVACFVTDDKVRDDLLFVDLGLNIFNYHINKKSTGDSLIYCMIHLNARQVITTESFATTRFEQVRVVKKTPQSLRTIETALKVWNKRPFTEYKAVI